MFATAVGAGFGELGYTMTGSGTLFGNQSGDTDLALGGEVTWFTKGTRGPGFQVGLLVHWSLFSRMGQKVLYETTTAGYADTQQKSSLNTELARALQDAVAGIASDPAFQAIALQKSTAAATTLTTGSAPAALVLARPAARTFANYGEVVREAMQSVVTVRTPAGHGSGFIIGANGYVLTNQHVVKGADNIEVILDNGVSFDASVVRADENQDVALLKILGKGYKPLVLDSRDEQAVVGTDVLAIGTPENIQLGQSVTRGIISGKRVLENHRYLQTDVAISPGNSGGPLINTATGAVIGIIAAKVRAQGAEGIGFGLPIGECIRALGLVFE